jgi:hypothetical protein
VRSRKLTVESQANALAEIFWLAHSLHEPEGTHVQELGSRLPEGVKVWVVEESAQTIYLVLSQRLGARRRWRDLRPGA